MEFKKPEDVTDGPDWKKNADSDGDSGADEPETVKFIDDEIPLNEAVRLSGEMLKSPEAFGMASGSEVRELRETVEQQRKAIAELADAIEVLASTQGQIVTGGGDSGPSVVLESEPLRGIYDPIGEFGGAE